MNLGMALAGYGQAQPEIQRLQEYQRQQQQRVGMGNALKNYAAQNPNAQRPPDPMQMLDLLSKSGMAPDQMAGAWEEYSKSVNPIDRLQNQLDMGMQKLDFSRQRIEDQQNFLLKMQGMKETGMDSRATKRDTAQSATRDIGAVEKELADQRSYLTGLLNSLGPKAIDSQDYKDAKAEFMNLRKELEGMRKGGGAKTFDAPASPGGQTSASDIPQEAINQLKAAPGTAAQFNEIFGAGAAEKLLGQ